MSELGAVQCPIIVGRDDILELLDRAVAATAKGRGRALFLSGSAGLGKTRLMSATYRKAQVAGIRVGSGSVAPQDLLVPLASIREFATGIRGDAAWGTLSEDLLAIDGQHEGDSLGARRLMVRAVADRILEAIDRPTMLVFDDLHWTDEMSLEVIGELARHLSDLPLLIVADYRADELPAGTIHREWRARLLSQRVAEEIRLRNFTIDETGLATTLILGGELPAPREVVEAVHERTNGIPLHIEELLAALDADARTDGRRIREAGVPDTIADAVLARLGRLSPEAQTLARAGAVLGRCFSPDVIAGMVDQQLEQIEPTIEELIDASFLYPFDYIDQGYYDFRHQLLRDAVYDAVPISQKRRFHAQAAEFVMALEASSVIHASRHYEQAGLGPKAFDAALTGAKEASRISARHEAFELYERVIANMPSELTAGEQADLYSQYAQAAGAIEHNEECSRAAERARELYLQAGRPIDAAEMLDLISMRDIRSGASRAKYSEYTIQALAEVEALPPSPERDKSLAYLRSCRADDLLRASELDAAREAAIAARALAESVDDRETLLECDLLLARIDIADGRYETGMRDGLTAARAARDAGFETVSVTGYRNLGIMALRIMDPETAEVAVAEGWQYADAIEQSHCRQMMACTTALLDWGAGRWDAADERARHEMVDRGCRRGEAGSLDVVGLVALGRGRPAEARRWLTESFELGTRMDEVEFLLTPLWGLAETDLLDGNIGGAIERCEEGYRIAVETGERALFIPFVVTGTRALLAARRPADGEGWLGRARDHLEGWDPVSGAAISHAEGLLRVAVGSLSAGREALERAVRGWDERRRVWEATWARLDLARCLIRMNRHGDASAVIAKVKATALAIQSDPLLRVADELARAGRGRGTLEEPWFPLTAREFEVAGLVAEGLTNAEIAERLVIAPKTASAHIEHILAKLGVTRRAEIAAWAANVRGAPAPERGSGSGVVAARR
ncbi:MAG TPA: AAA family ATPase [Candidatus Limnocylindrales bacterium]|nr:AAA family ATPase [Candidatus Limnocylindrales bacterium]